MKTTRTWARPGWPWELETLALFFAITAVAIPALLTHALEAEIGQLGLLEQHQRAHELELLAASSTRTDVVWAMGVFIIYIVHVLFATRTRKLISTPISHLFMPLLFSLFLYFRLTTRVADVNIVTTITSGSIGQILAWSGGVIILTTVIARIRMARFMAHFKDIEWQISRRTVFNSSYWGLTVYLYPMLYLPSRYHAFAEGILIEGWMYTMSVPYAEIQAIERVSKRAHFSTGSFFATSRAHLVSIKLKDLAEPIFISPEDPDVFAQYTRQALQNSRRRAAAAAPVAKAA